MKKSVLSIAAICFAACSTSLFAQDNKDGKKDKKETQEIIIRKKGEKDSKITVEIKGDAITINGKPLSEFKDDQITINKRNIIVRDGNGATRFKMTQDDLEEFMLLANSPEKEESSAFLGVTTRVYNNGTGDTKPKGAEIINISKESAAEKAGLKNEDVITKINDKKVTDPASLSEAVTSFKPREEVTVYYIRDGKESSLKATLGERKESKILAYSFNSPDGMERSFSIPRVPGIEIDDMAPRVWAPGSNYNFDTYPRRQKLGIKIQDTEQGNGVKVLEVEKDSPAEKAGLKKDDVITEIANKKVSNTDEMREEMMINMEKSSYNINAIRNGNAMRFDIKIPKKLKTANL